MIKLRLFEHTDITDEYVNAINSEQARFLFTGERTWTKQDLSDYLSNIISDPCQKMYAICQDGNHVGNIKITLDFKNRTCGYGRLMWKSGTGTGTEALKTMIKTVFENYPDIDVITDMAASNNTGSLISNLKAGMKVMGVWRDKLCIGGHRIDGIPVGITRQEYNERLNEKELIDVNFGF